MSTKQTQTFRSTLPSFDEIERLIRQARRERSKALSAAIKSAATSQPTDAEPALAHGVRA